MFLDDLIEALSAGGFGSYGIELFKGSNAVIPKGDGPYISLNPTGGFAAAGTHNAAADGLGPAYERPSAQVVVRASDFDAADERGRAVHEFLHRLGQRSGLINGTWWVYIRVGPPPADLGKDDVGRPRVAFNLDCEKRVSPATS